MELKLDSETMREILKGALLQQLTPEAQQQLVENAVKHILQEKIHQGYGAPTTLQQLFNDTIRTKAAELIDAALEEPDVVEKIRSVVLEATMRAFTPGSEARKRIVDRLSEAIKKELVGY